MSKTPNPIISSTLTMMVLVSNCYFCIQCEAAAALVLVGISHVRLTRLTDCWSLAHGLGSLISCAMARISQNTARYSNIKVANQLSLSDSTTHSTLCVLLLPCNPPGLATPFEQAHVHIRAGNAATPLVTPRSSTLKAHIAIISAEFRRSVISRCPLVVIAKPKSVQP